MLIAIDNDQMVKQARLVKAKRSAVTARKPVKQLGTDYNHQRSRYLHVKFVTNAHIGQMKLREESLMSFEMLQILIGVIFAE